MIAKNKTILDSIQAVYRSNYELTVEKAKSKGERDFITSLLKQNDIIVTKLLSMVTP